MKKMSVLIPIIAITFVLASCDSGDPSGNTPGTSINSTYTLSVVRNLENGGSVNVTVNASTTPVAGPSTHAAGTAITLTAVPESGYAFQNWTPTNGNLPAFLGGSATSAVITFQMNSNVLIRANFQSQGGGTGYTLTVNRNPAGGGTTTPASSQSNIAGGTPVSISATPSNGYTFTNWTVQSGTATLADADSQNTTVTLSTNATVTANFQQQGVNPTTYTLTVNANPAGGGTTTPASSQSNIAAGTPVSISATPSNGYTFSNWTVTSGTATLDSTSSQNTTVTLSTNATVTANFTSTGGGGPTSVTAIPVPQNYPKYNGITMKADGQDIDLYAVKVNSTRRFSLQGGGEGSGGNNNRYDIPVGMFDMTGTPTVVITGLEGASDGNVVVRPLAKNVSKTVSGTTVTLTLPSTGQYSVEWNNSGGATSTDPRNAVLIFANPVESFSGDIIKEPGVYTENIFVQGGQTLYLKGGAVIRGRVTLYSNSKVVGRGIIDGSQFWNWNRQNGVNYNNAQIPILVGDVYGAGGGSNIEIRGVSVFDADGWCVQLHNASDVTIDNLKIISSRCNSDGISIQDSNGVTVTNSFIRSWDDGVTLKNYPFTTNNTNNIRVNNTIFWTDLAQCMEIGYETNKEKGKGANAQIYNARFEDITVFHALHKPVISIHNGDACAVSDIHWENITIENYQVGQGDATSWNFVIDFINRRDLGFNTDNTSNPSSIANVTVDNVWITGKNPSARFDPNPNKNGASGSMSTVTISNIYYNGNKIGSPVSNLPNGVTWNN